MQPIYLLLSLGVICSSITGTSGACNQSEYLLWKGDTGRSFTEKLQRCAVEAMGDRDFTAQNLVAAFKGNLSQTCANCFGDCISCGAKHCTGLCIKDPGCAECLACTKANGCDDQLQQCIGSGLTAPPKPRSISATRDDLQSPSNGVTESASGLILLLSIATMLI